MLDTHTLNGIQKPGEIEMASPMYIEYTWIVRRFYATYRTL